MGDRRNIIVNRGEGTPGVALYTHWTGNRAERTLATALDRGESRWSDPDYLTRIIFSEMIRDDVDGTTGYGLGVALDGKTAPCEASPGYDLVVDTQAQTVNGVSFKAYINAHLTRT